MAEAGEVPGNTLSGGAFPPTHWSVVLQAAQTGSPHADQALARLCQAYWYPLYAFARRQGCSPLDAEDLTQGFFLHLIEKNTLAVADRARGRFRTFLLSSMKHFLINEWQRGQALKRGGAHVVVSLDADTAETRYAAEPTGGVSPENLYDRNWAWTVLDRVLGRLRTEEETGGKGNLFHRLKPALMGERLGSSYAEVAAEFNLTETALRMAVHRLRRRFRKLLREEIAPTVAGPKEVDEEIRHLFAALGG